MDKINLIIPCAGCGQRFIDAGYDVYKPAIHVFEKPMILNVTGAFPKETVVWIIVDDKHKSELAGCFSEQDHVKLITIAPHKNGPAWSLMMAADKLPKDEACFVAYNDVTWKWNFADVMNFISENRADGVVFTQRGFHPHLYKNNFSAFCRTDGNVLLEIKEKGSFTDDWMNEALSTGVYYFASTAQMAANTKYLTDNNIKTAGEYYPSEIYNLMLKQGLSVFTYETDRFLHAGVPEQLEDAEEWKKIFTAVNKPHELPTLIMMCGTGERMKVIAGKNKAGLLIGDQPMFRFVAEKNGSTENTFLVNDETEVLLSPEMKAINIHVQTNTQTESLKLATYLFDCDNGLLVLSTDCYGIYDADMLKDMDNYAMVLFGFKPRMIQKKQGEAHTGFSYAGADVTEIHLKSIQKNDLGLAGMYYFPDAKTLKELDNIDCSRSGSMDHFAQYLIDKNHRVGFIELYHYVHLGTPEELNEYLFWNKFFN